MKSKAIFFLLGTGKGWRNHGGDWILLLFLAQMEHPAICSLVSLSNMGHQKKHLGKEIV